METMVATLSSDGGSGQAIVDPGPLDPGRTNGLAKSAAENKTQPPEGIQSEVQMTSFSLLQ